MMLKSLIIVHFPWSIPEFLGDMISASLFWPHHVLMILRLYHLQACSFRVYPKFKQKSKLDRQSNLIGCFSMSKTMQTPRRIWRVPNPTATGLGTCRRLITFCRQRSGHGGMASVGRWAGDGRSWQWLLVSQNWMVSLVSPKTSRNPVRKRKPKCEASHIAMLNVGRLHDSTAAIFVHSTRISPQLARMIPLSMQYYQLVISKLAHGAKGSLICCGHSCL